MNKSVTIHVQNESAQPRWRESISTGIPLPYRMQLTSVDLLQLVDVYGEEVPTQFMPLAWWEDGRTIKWVLVSFQADIAAQARAHFELHIPSAAKPDLQQLCIARREGRQVMLHTGSWRATLDPHAPVMFSSMAIRTADEWNDVPFHSPSWTGVTLTTADGKRWIADRPQKIDVEHNGPVRADIHVCGRFRLDDGRNPDDAQKSDRGRYVDGEQSDDQSNDNGPGFRYDLRLEVGRNQAHVKWNHMLICEQDARLHDVQLHMPVANAAYTLGNDDNAIQVFSTPHATDDGSLYGVLQESECDVRCGELHQAPQTGIGDQRNSGYWWMTADTTHARISATIRYFQQAYPKSLTANANGMTIGLLPGISATKDSFAPAKQWVDAYVLREGESRTHEWQLAFHEAQATNAEIGEGVRAFHEPLLAHAPWEWYTASGALGDVIGRSDEKYTDYEQAVDQSLDVYIGRRETMRLYGDRNFGDDYYQTIGTWNNGEYDYLHVGMLHFLRGAGKRWYTEFVQPYARHLMDIDICLVGKYAGYVHQHAEWHNAEKPKLGSHAWLRGLTEYYCFSGDFRARDVSRIVGETWSSSILHNGIGEATERGITWPVISMIAMYETFAEARYLQAATKLIDYVLDVHDPVEGHFKGSMYRETTKNNWGTFVIGSPVLESLIMYARLTGSEQAKQTVVRAAQRLARLNWIDDPGVWEYTHSMLDGSERRFNAKTDKMVTPAVLAAYLFSGDEELLQKAAQSFAYSAPIPAKDGKDLGQSYCFGVRIPALLEQAREKAKTKG